jgi:calcium-dependent protein kinase
MYKANMTEDDERMLLNEIDILKDLDHPNIVKMYEFFQDEKRYYIITE